MEHKLNRSLFIGIGGTGIRAILSVKKRLLEVYDPNEMKKVPPMIEFLGIDTDDKDKRETEEGMQVKLEPAEFKKLRVDNVADTIKANKHIRDRIPKEIQYSSHATIHSGAGQIRALGTLALMANYKKVKDALVSKVSMIKNWDAEGNRGSGWSTSGSDVNVFIIFSTSGGTGSGMFIDIAYMLREHCNLDDDDRLFSYILLPEPFIGKTGTRNVIPNSYAAFKELDFLMNHQKGRSEYNISFDYGHLFGGDKIRIQSRPFDYVYVISNENVDGIMYNQINDIIEFMGYALFVTTGAVGEAADSIWDNLKGMLNTEFAMDDHSEVKFGRYLCFGISELFYNGERTGKHAVNEVSAKFFHKLMTEAQEDVYKQSTDYIQANNLSEKGPNHNDVIDRILQPVSRPVEDVNPDRNSIENVKLIKDNYINKLKNGQTELAQRNRESFEKESKDKLKKYLEERLKSWDGLDHAIKFLDHLTAYFNTVRNEMDTEIAEINETINQIKNYYKNSLEDIKAGLDTLWPPLRRNRTQSAIESYLNYVKQEGFQQQEKIKRQQARIFFSDLITFCRKQRNEYNDSLLAIKENYKTLNQAVSDTRNAKAISKPYTIDLSYDLISAMNSSIPNLDDFIAFLKTNKTDYTQWLSFNPLKMNHWLNTFSSNLSDIKKTANLSAEEVLMKLEEEERKNIVKKLDRMSSPLCPYIKGYVTGKMDAMHIIGVENETNTILLDNDADLLSQINYSHDPTWSTTNDPKRWLIFKTEAALPGYALKNFEQYKIQYENRIKRSRNQRSSSISFHIYDGWERLPELIPEVQYENALKFWALGYSDPFNLIKRERGRYWLYTQIGNEIKNPKHKGWEKICESQDRIKAFETFRTNEDYINVINHLIEERISQLGEKNITENLHDYLEKLEAEVSKASTNEMSHQLAKEAKEIKEYIEELEAEY